MKRYRYKVRTGKGAIMSGVLLAEHKGEVCRSLRGNMTTYSPLQRLVFSERNEAAFFRWRAGTALQGTGYPA